MNIAALWKLETGMLEYEKIMKKIFFVSYINIFISSFQFSRDGINIRHNSDLVYFDCSYNSRLHESLSAS